MEDDNKLEIDVDEELSEAQSVTDIGVSDRLGQQSRHKTRGREHLVHLDWEAMGHREVKGDKSGTNCFNMGGRRKLVKFRVLYKSLIMALALLVLVSTSAIMSLNK